jgi:membrane-associated protein
MIDAVLRFFDGNIYLFLLIIPFAGELGIPLGSMFFILLAGSQANNIQGLFILFLVVLTSEVVGDVLSYDIGRLFGESVWIKKISNKRNFKKLFVRSKLFLEKHGGVWVFITRFLVPLAGPYVNYIAGLEAYDFRKFFLFAFLGEVIYSALILFLGYLFKETFEEIISLFTNFSLLIIIGFILYAIGKNIFTTNRRKKNPN